MADHVPMSAADTTFDELWSRAAAIPAAEARASSSAVTFELDALAHLIAVVVAHTRSTEADVHTLDALLDRVLAEHQIQSIDQFNDKVGKHLQDIEQEASSADVQSS